MSSRAKTELLRLLAELRDDIAAAEAKAHGLEAWAQRLAMDQEVYIPAGLLHHFYTAIESALARAAAVLEGSPPSGPDSHARLLHLSTLELPGIRPAILFPEDRDPLRELLEFRHLYRHGYGVVLRPERLRELAEAAVAAWPGIHARLDAFAKFVQDCATRAQ